MKISEMSNDQATEAMIRISAPFQNICEDEELITVLEAIKNRPKEEELVKSIGRILPKFVLFALKNHKADLYEIIGALSCQPTGKVGKMNFAETVRMLKESYDDILHDFFTTSAEAEGLSVSLLPSA